MTTMQQQIVVLRITRPADGTAPVEWDWSELIEDECEIIAAGPVVEFEDNMESEVGS